MGTTSKYGRRGYWLWVTRPEYYLDDVGRADPRLEDIGSWSCARETRDGDLVLLYRTKLKDAKTIAERRRRGDPPIGCDIGYLIRAESNSYPDPEWAWGCECSTLFVFENPLTLEDIRRDPVLSAWGVYRRKFFGTAFRIEPDVWRALIRAAAPKNPGFLEALTAQGETVSSDVSKNGLRARDIQDPKDRSRGDELPPFDRALLRLQILTAPPSPHRELSPAWPDGFIRAAAGMCSLSDSELRSQAIAGAGYVHGGHRVQTPLAMLRNCSTADEWQELLCVVRQLNSEEVGVEDVVSRIARELGGSQVSLDQPVQGTNRRSVGPLEEEFAKFFGD